MIKKRYMALEIEIGVKDQITKVIEGIDSRFANLESRAKELGKTISSEVSSSTSKAKNLADSVSMQIGTIEQLKKRLNEVIAIREKVKSKGNAATEEEHQALLRANKEYKNLTKEINEEEKALKELGKAFKDAFNDADKKINKVSDSFNKVEKDTGGLKEAFEKAGTAAAALFTVDKAIDFGKKVIEVRGEMQALEASFSAMLGSRENAQKLLQESIDFAATTPFDLQQVASGAKQLLAYGTAQEQVLGDMKMLGDVAAGLSIPLSQLIYLYGTLRAQGRVMAIDIRQFAMRGIPIYDELAKVMGVAKNEVAGLVSEGKVTFETVEQAFKNMTSEGGKFAGLTDSVFNTVNGKISNLGDSIYQMFNEIGKKTEGLMNTGLNVASSLVDNYQQIGRVIGDIVIAYGSYKAAIIATSAIHSVQAKIIARNAAIERAAVIGLNRAYMRKIALLRTIATLHATIKALNPFAIATAAAVTATVAFVRYAKSLSDGTRALKEYKKEREAANKLEEQAQKLIAQIEAESNSQKRTQYIDDLIKIYPQLLDKYDREKLLLMDIKQLKAEIAAINTNNVGDEIKKLQDEIKKREEWLNKYGSSSNVAMNASEQLAISNLRNKLAQYEKDYPEFFAPLGPEKPTTITTTETETKDKEYWENKKKEALGKLEKMTIEELGSNEGKLLIAEYQKATEMLEKYSFDQITKKLESDAEKLKEEQEKRLKSIEDFGKKSNDLIKSISDKESKIRQESISESWKKELADLESQKKELSAKALELGNAMDSIFTGNVNLSTRQGATLKTANIKGKKVLVTPVLPNGQTLSDEELQDYINNTLAKSSDILKGDTKKIVVGVGDEKSIKELEAIHKQYSAILKLIAEYENMAALDIEKKKAEEFDKLLSKYKVLDNQLKDLNDEYIANQSALLEGMTDENKTKVESALNELARSYREGIQGIYDALDTSEFSDPEWMKSLKDKTADELYNELVSLELLFDSLSSAMVLTEKDAIALNAKIEILKETLNDDKTGGAGWTDLYEILNNIGSSLSSIGDEIGGIAGNIVKNIGSITSTIGKFATSVKGLKDAVSEKDISGGISGVLGTIQAVIAAASWLNEVTDRAFQSYVKAAQAAYDYARALEDIEKESRKSALTNAFGTDEYKVFLENYANSLVGVNDVKERWAKIFAETPGLKGLFNEQYFIDNLFTQGKFTSDMRTDWQKFWGMDKNIATVEISSFFDEEGNLLGEKLKAWYEEYGEGMAENERKMVEEMIAAWEDYESSVEGIQSYIASLTGDIADDISKKMVDSFIKTGSAISDLSDYTQDFAANLAESIIKSMLLSEIFTPDNQDAIAKMIASGDTQGAIDLFNSLMEQSEELAPEIQRFLESLSLNIDSAQQTATAGGFQSMSQDTGNELNGRFTAIQISNSAIEEYNRQMSEHIASIRAKMDIQFPVIDDIRNIQAKSLLELMEINDNTKAIVKPIKEMNEKVNKINEKVSKL